MKGMGLERLEETRAGGGRKDVRKGWRGGVEEVWRGRDEGREASQTCWRAVVGGMEETCGDGGGELC